MPTPAPGFAKHPDYAVDIEPSTARVRVHAGNTLVADSVRALKVSETNLPPVWYVPMADVAQELLIKTTTSTHCPFKGDASYWRVEAGDTVVDDALWGYENPFTECLPLQNHVAFYPNRVTIDVQLEG